MYVKVSYYLCGRVQTAFLRASDVSEVLVEPHVVWMRNGNSYTLTKESYDALMAALS